MKVSSYRKNKGIKYLDDNLREAFINHFGCYLPRRLEWAVRNNCTKDLKRLCDHLDMVDFHYRRYVAGIHKTMHRVIREVNLLYNHPLYKTKYLEDILRHTTDNILNHELYELMSRHKHGMKKIEKAIKKTEKKQ